MQKSKNCKFSLNFDVWMEACKPKMLQAGFYKNKGKYRWSHQTSQALYKRNASAHGKGHSKPRANIDSSMLDMQSLQQD